MFYSNITESNIKMLAPDLVGPPGFSLQYPNLAPSHAEYAKVGSRSQAHTTYFYIGFQPSVRFVEPLSDQFEKVQERAYREDVRQLGHLLQRLITEVSSDFGNIIRVSTDFGFLL
jgi:hypothetical protein